jgi:peptidoglycan L-alanyl-D-glutamate endopeptidase CwlK
MSFKYSSKSLAKLNTCHPDLQKILKKAIKHYDITILEGIRTKERQEELVRTGMSKTMNSKHLDQGDGYSHAVDCALWPIDWNDRDRFVFLQGYLKGLADQMKESGEITHTLRLGVDWDGDGNIKEHSFFDGPHIELSLK